MNKLATKTPQARPLGRFLKKESPFLRRKIIKEAKSIQVDSESESEGVQQEQASAASTEIILREPSMPSGQQVTVPQESQKNPRNPWRAIHPRDVFMAGFSFYKMIMDDEYFSYVYHNRSMPNRQPATHERHPKNRYRNTNAYVNCLGGCKERVNVNFETYNERNSEYLVCSDNCAQPIASHKQCLRDSMAANWATKFVSTCSNCGNDIRMHGTFRLGVREIPHTAIETTRLLIKHLLFRPILYALFTSVLFFISAWQDYWEGYTKQPPGKNPFAYEYQILSDTDPSFQWRADSMFRWWYSGLTMYLLVAFIWRCGLGWICRKIWSFTAGLLWRFDN